MSGVKGRSGRRNLASVPRHFDLPQLGGSESTVMEHLEALSSAVRTGKLDPRVGDTLHRIAAAQLRAIAALTDKYQLLDALERLSRRVEEIELSAKAHEVATRQHARTGDDEPAVFDP
jgi:hypothetical protein